MKRFAACQRLAGLANAALVMCVASTASAQSVTEPLPPPPQRSLVATPMPYEDAIAQIEARGRARPRAVEVIRPTNARSPWESTAPFPPVDRPTPPRQ